MSLKPNICPHEISHPIPLPADNKEIPDDVMICGIEIMAAALLALIPSGYTQAAAAVLAADALSRGIEGLKALSAKNQENQEFDYEFLRSPSKELEFCRH